MNGKLAKRIRKKVYGDYSIREVKYERDSWSRGMIRCAGLRGRYQQVKKDVKNVRGKNISLV